jgi:hypothetical protein
MSYSRLDKHIPLIIHVMWILVIIAACVLAIRFLPHHSYVLPTPRHPLPIGTRRPFIPGVNSG